MSSASAASALLLSQKTGPQAHFNNAEMWCVECSNGPLSGRGNVPVHAAEPAGSDELVNERVVPVPTPGEPARKLTLGRHNGGANPGTEEVAECLAWAAPSGRLGMRLVPAGENARVPVRRLVHDRAGDDRAATLERMAEALQFLRRQPELGLKVVELRRTCVGEMAQQPRPALVLGFHARELGAADRVEQRSDLLGDEQALAAVDREDQVGARAELAEPRELRRGPLPEAPALACIRLLVACREQARER